MRWPAIAATAAHVLAGHRRRRALPRTLAGHRRRLARLNANATSHVPNAPVLTPRLTQCSACTLYRPVDSLAASQSSDDGRLAFHMVGASLAFSNPSVPLPIRANAGVVSSPQLGGAIHSMSLTHREVRILPDLRRSPSISVDLIRSPPISFDLPTTAC